MYETYLDPLGRIPQIHRSRVPSLVVAPDLADADHPLELGEIPGDEVEEGKLVVVLCLLVAVLHDGVVAVHQRLLGKLLPARLVTETTKYYWCQGKPDT